MSTIAECLREIMVEQQADVAWAGEPDLLLAAFAKFGGQVTHPLNRIQAVISAARNSKIFESDGFIRACDSTGRREVLLPVFKLKGSAPEID